MRDIKLARVFLDAAKLDLLSLRSTINMPDYPDEIFGFHVQQATEKSFKAWLVLLNKPAPISHDLTLLSDMVKAADTEVTRFRRLLEYTPYAVQFRYTSSSGIKSLDRTVALRLSEELAEHVETMLEGMKENR